MSAKRGRPRGSEKNPIELNSQGDNQDSQHSLLDNMDALNVEEEVFQPEPYSPPAARVTRSNSGTRPTSTSSTSPRRTVVARRTSTSPHAAAATAVAIAVQKLSVSGFVVEHLKSGQFIAPPNAVFVYDNSDSRSVRTVTKKMAKIRREFPDKEMHEFSAKGTAGILPTAVAGASVGVLTVNLKKCFDESKRSRISSSDDDE